ncbi:MULTISPECIES: pheST operon leader peptide PheM [Yersiniaceae]|uniref:pheST attenuator peptide n=1 Tax=Nissabacter archeti TaxID=1917880 RepID=A0ABS5JJA3_9GAMM|nr:MULTISPECIES: pheST operon leader peptide PheM [Yersiniaceae]MBS0970030.1 pheST operon leader peptide PheM [Nissabacter archeti]MDV5140064.1 pheST operon leader peptide PheM [Chimaeribacter arupi]WKZ94281.1 pheST operon leader peptide PheM [Chimaeribacter arupi]
MNAAVFRFFFYFSA